MRQPNKEACAEPLCDVPEKRTCPPQPRINMYKDEEGKFNGTAMISRISPRSTAKSCEEVRMSDPMPTSSANSTTAASRVGPRQARQQKHTPTRSSIPEENSRWRVAIPETTTAWVADTCVEAPALCPLGLGPPQHHMGHGHGHGMGGGHMRGGTGAVPFGAGDWKCGENGCGYHKTTPTS